MENCLPFDNALAADLVGEVFAYVSLSIRYAGNSLSISDAQVEGKCCFWMLSSPTAPGKAKTRKVGMQCFEALQRKSPAYHSVQQLSVTS